MTKLFRIMIAAGLIGALLGALHGALVWAATPPEPIYGTATVDGDPSEWASDPVFAQMKNGAGKLQAELYLRYDCTNEVLYARVLPAGYANVVVITGDETTLEDVWMLIDSSRYHIPGVSVPPYFDEFAWINERTESGRDVADGWEASLSLAPGTYALDAHTNTLAFDDEEGWTEETAGTGWVTLEIDCSWCTGSIGDYVWNDENGNGLQGELYPGGPLEVGINDVEMELWLDDGDGEFEFSEDTKLTTMLTQDDGSGNPGWYLFTGLCPGTYFVRINPAEFDSGGTLYEYSPTVPDVDSNAYDTVDSDGDNPDCPYNHTAGEPGCGSQSTWEDNILAETTLAAGSMNDLTIDFGVVYTGPPTAVTLSSFAATSSTSGSANWLWLGLVGLPVLAAGSLFWTKRHISW